MKTYQLRDPNDVYFVSVVLVIGTWKEYQNWVEKKFGVPPIKNNFYTGYHSAIEKDNKEEKMSFLIGVGIFLAGGLVFLLAAYCVFVYAFMKYRN